MSDGTHVEMHLHDASMTLRDEGGSFALAPPLTLPCGLELRDDNESLRSASESLGRVRASR